MCMSSPSMPQAPKQVIIPQAPIMSDIVAPVIKQSAPQTADSVFKRRGKAGMVIQMGTGAGTNLPGSTSGTA